MIAVKTVAATITGRLAWKRRSRANRALSVLSLALAAFVALAFAWASLNPDPGNAARYFVFYFVWGLCALGVLLGVAEYKTSPLRRAASEGTSSSCCTS